jgi:hypothetical protein
VAAGWGCGQIEQQLTASAMGSSFTSACSSPPLQDAISSGVAPDIGLLLVRIRSRPALPVISRVTVCRFEIFVSVFCQICDDMSARDESPLFKRFKSSK